MSNDDDIRAKLAAIGKVAADQTNSSMGALAQYITAKSHPYVVADMVAARIHQFMFFVQEELTQSDPTIPTELTHALNVVVLRRGRRWTMMGHAIGDWRVHFGWGEGEIRVPPQSYVDGGQMKDPAFFVESMANFLIGRSDTVIAYPPPALPKQA